MAAADSAAVTLGQVLTPQHPHDFASYRPRDQLSPVNGVDSLDRHISRATETEDSLDRYLKLLRFVRSTTLLLAILLLTGCMVFGAGVGVAVAIAGLRPLTAAAIGASGSTAFGLTVVLRMRAYLRSGWRALFVMRAGDQQTEVESTDPDAVRQLRRRLQPPCLPTPIVPSAAQTT